MNWCGTATPLASSSGACTAITYSELVDEGPRMRLIHTADVHLDASFAAAGFPAGFGNRRRQSLRDALAAILRRAREWPADAVLIAGDLFESERVARDTLEFLKEEFAALESLPVFIAPGNHDPFDRRSPYATEPWPQNVHVFCEPRWTAYQVPNVPMTVHGFAFDGPDISANPFGLLETPADGRLHVAVAHGSERRHQPPHKKSYAPFDASDAAAEGLAYLALGHFHTLKSIDAGLPTRMYYPGAPEGLGFGETGRHYYLEVDVCEGSTAVQAVPASNMVYETHEFDCSDVVSSQEIVEKLRALAPGDGLRRIARVTLRGACSPSVRDALDAVQDSAASSFEYLDLVDRTEMAVDYDALAREQTSLGMFLARMNQELRDAPHEERMRMVARARELGLAAFQNRQTPIHGIERAPQ